MAGYGERGQVGVMRSTDLEGGFGLDEPIEFRVSQAVELLTCSDFSCAIGCHNGSWGVCR